MARRRFRDYPKGRRTVLDREGVLMTSPAPIHGGVFLDVYRGEQSTETVFLTWEQAKRLARYVLKLSKGKV